MTARAHWLPRLKWLAVGALVLFQSLAYATRVPLSLGPRVVFSPWVLQRGYVLYENIGDQHSPLMTLILIALAPLFPNELQSARFVLLALITLVALLTFWAAYRAAGWWGGLGALLFVVIWSPTVEFGKLWHETFLTPLYLLLLISYDPASPPRSTRRLLILGLIGGTAIMVKQHAAIVVAALVAWNSLANWRAHRAVRDILRDAALMLSAAALPMLGFIAYHYMRVGTLDNFFYWTVAFNFFGNFRKLAALAPESKEVALIASACLLLPAAIWHWVELIRRKDARAWHLGWGLTLLAASALTAYPRFEFFHLQASLPILGWLSAVGTARAWTDGSARSGANDFIVGTLIALGLYWGGTAGSKYQIVFEPNTRQYIAEYTDLIPLAQAVREKIGPSDCVYVFPDAEDLANLYYLLKCPPPKFWIFNYPWFRTEYINQRTLATFNANSPKWILFFLTHWNVKDATPEIVRASELDYDPVFTFDWAGYDVILLKRSH